MLLLTKQWEGDSGRKGEGERVEETRAAFVMLGFGKGTRDGLVFMSFLLDGIGYAAL